MQSLLHRNEILDRRIPAVPAFRLGDAPWFRNVPLESLCSGIQGFSLPALWLQKGHEEKVVVTKRRF